MFKYKVQAPDAYKNIDMAMDGICAIEDVIGYSIEKVLSPDAEIIYQLDIHTRNEGLVRIGIPALQALNAKGFSLTHQIMYAFGWQKEARE